MNPGSVGLSYDHVQPDDDLRIDAFAAYARIDADDDRLELAFRRVPFDRTAVLAAIARAASRTRSRSPRSGSRASLKAT